MTVAPDGATVTCSPREFVGMEALDGKRWVVSAPGDVAPLALRFSFPEDVAIDDGYFSEEEEQKYIAKGTTVSLNSGRIFFVTIRA